MQPLEARTDAKAWGTSRKGYDLSQPLRPGPNAVAKANERLAAPRDLQHLDQLVLRTAPTTQRRTNAFFTPTSAPTKASTEVLLVPELRQMISGQLSTATDAHNFYAAVGIVDDANADQRFYLDRLSRMFGDPAQPFDAEDFDGPPREVAHALSDTLAQLAQPRWSLFGPSGTEAENAALVVTQACRPHLLPRVHQTVAAIRAFHIARRKKKLTQVKGAAAGVAGVGIAVGVPAWAIRGYKAGTYARQGWTFVAATGRYVKDMPKAWYNTPVDYNYDYEDGPVYPQSPQEAVVTTCVAAIACGLATLMYCHIVFTEEVPALSEEVRQRQSFLQVRGLLPGPRRALPQGQDV